MSDPREEDETVKGKNGKSVAAFNLDEDVLAQIERVSSLTHRSKSNVVNLVLTRHLQTYVSEPELL